MGGKSSKPFNALVELGDVKNVFMYLIEKGEYLQKDLVYELELTMAKVIRIFDTLEEKELVKLISYGKTNIIVLE